ncbi:hypothetical protein AGR7B_Cc20025 [Agrobacterium deltaense RV3]|uniref:Uncharacterized protein n=1 Tax=Agrobacterium deltaense NCPPB 1641 TaxID=1183425 RepID=A0A1S7TNI1_9HYPH|nr:hypothetical protein AGR7B_Cc20025 [Agrobacterium deltaense RV3]CVI56163.1 hypothetical protein AGR7A_Cc270054 [Agrobacterium deltaense NCPPB 1641]
MESLLARVVPETTSLIPVLVTGI